jgi:hypothetical protein
MVPAIGRSRVFLRHDHSWRLPTIVADGYKDRTSDGSTIGLNTVACAGS